MNSSLKLKSALPKIKILLYFLFSLFLYFFISLSTSAATFEMQTGYYIGNAGTLPISGLGFQPEVVIIKSNTTAGSGIWKSSAMPANNTAFFSATANNTGTLITLNADGFTVANNANTNSVNVRYQWIAFAGSDCTATGTICVGTYTGNGTSPRAINTGFGPALVLVKRSTAVGANFRTTSMAVNNGSYFTTTATDATGTLFTSLDAAGFTVGATNNTNAGLYYYIAFKSVAGAMNVGTYTGNGIDSRNIAGVGFVPDFVFVKNTTSATANNRIAYMNSTDAYGDYSSRIDGTSTNSANIIQALQNDGFQVGSGVQSNENGATIFYAAFAGTPDVSSSGSFQMDTGTYTGNGTSQSISGLGFSPNLVILKDTSTGNTVFRTSLMKGDTTAYTAAATANFATGITSLNADGFSVGASLTTNAAAATYHWQAFGNAWNPETKSGAANFTIGALMGNGIDNRNITDMPFQANLVAIKRNGATAGAFRTSAMAGDLSGFFSASAEAANVVQSLSATSFQIGTAANANTAANLYHWFAFATGTNFYVNSYTGNGSSQNITAPGFKPDLVWAKRTTSVNPVHRSSSIIGDSTQYFTILADAASKITSFISTGFTVGSGAEVNTSTGLYRYLVWKISAIATISTEDNQTANIASNSANQFIGTFTIVRDYGSAELTSITISETGTINAQSDLTNIDIYYETAANCSYEGTETLFGTTAAFNGSETATISGSTTISTSQICLHIVLDTLASASDGETIELSIATPSTQAVISKGHTAPSTTIAIAGTSTIQSAGSLETDIVDNNGDSVGSPNINMNNRPFSFGNQTATGTLGTASQKIRVNNTTQSSQWNLTIAASDGITAFWDSTSSDYDFNDPTANGVDGPDGDLFGGRMTIDPSGATITPQIGCENTGLTLGSPASFSQAVIDNITLLSANGTADTNCYWDLTNIAISQTVPSEQLTGNYNIDMTITVTAI